MDPKLKAFKKRFSERAGFRISENEKRECIKRMRPNRANPKANPIFEIRSYRLTETQRGLPTQAVQPQVLQPSANAHFRRPLFFADRSERCVGLFDRIPVPARRCQTER